MTQTTTTEENENIPQWCPEQQIYMGGVVPENAQVQELLQKNGGYLRLFGYGSLCWNPGTGALAKPGVVGNLGKARGYKRCWAQKSTDHRGVPSFPGVVCTLLEDSEVDDIKGTSASSLSQHAPTMTEGVIYTIPPELVEECLEELDFREKGGYARDVIDVVEDKTGETHQALLYRGTPDNPAFWPRALRDLPLTAAIIAVADGPSGKNDVYLNRLDHFMTDASSMMMDADENDDTSALAIMCRTFQESYQLYFLFGSGSNQHNQLLLHSEDNAAQLVHGEDAHDRKEIVVCVPKNDQDPVKQLFVGGGHSGLLTRSGKLYIWGWNENGQLGSANNNAGVEDDTSDRPLPVVRQLLDLVVDKAAFGFSHTLVVEQGTGRLFAFGSNERGQANGEPSSTTVAAPDVTPSFLQEEEIVAVAAGLFHSAVINSQGELITFGCGRFGQSLSDNTDYKKEVWIGRWKPQDGSRLVDVACGRRHTIVVDDKGRVYSFGENKYGQLGRPIEEKLDPVPSLVQGLESISASSRLQVVSGWSHTVLIVESENGTTRAFGWGRNDKGQLGTGTTDSVPASLELFADKKIQSIVCGSESTMVLDTYSEIWGCGWNEHGNLSIGSDKDALSLTKTVGARVVGPPGSGQQLAVAAGGAHFLAARVEFNGATPQFR
jgi:alpha-tubulin suppressor-like RCC1 family protein/cation transport regulator ChaC